MIKKATVFLVLIIAGVWIFSATNTGEAETFHVEILALDDVPETNGLRRILIQLPNGEEVSVETLAPFFYRVGYQAKVSVQVNWLGTKTFKFLAD